MAEENRTELWDRAEDTEIGEAKVSWHWFAARGDGDYLDQSPSPSMPTGVSMMGEPQFECLWQQIENRISELDRSKASFLVASGWTREQIVAKIGMSPFQVDQLLRFGRFLIFLESAPYPEIPWVSVPSNLTESMFRVALSQVHRGSTESEKFARVRAIIFGVESLWDALKETTESVEETTKSVEETTKSVGKWADRVLAVFKGGCWLTTEEALEKSGVPRKKLMDCFSAWGPRRRTGRYVVESKVSEGRKLYRVVKRTGRIRGGSEKVMQFCESAKLVVKEAKKLASEERDNLLPNLILDQLVLLDGLFEDRTDWTAGESEKVRSFYETAKPLLDEAKNLTNRNISGISPKSILFKIVMIERSLMELSGKLTHR